MAGNKTTFFQRLSLDQSRAVHLILCSFNQERSFRSLFLCPVLFREKDVCDMVPVISKPAIEGAGKDL
jgi:hypothetical protein